MRQKIVIQAIVRDAEKALLLYRSQGTSATLNKYEFLGGRLNFGEQPEDAVWRYVQDLLNVGLQDESIDVRLFDTLSFISREDNAHTVLVLYEVYIHRKVTALKVRLPAKYSKYKWYRINTARNTIPLRDSAELIMSIIQTGGIPVDSYTGMGDIDAKQSGDPAEYMVYSDGGSRGNPGPSSAGFVLLDRDGNIIEQDGVYLGITTNNQAEYHGMRLGLERAHMLGAKTVDMYADSMLVVNQMNGIYSVKNRDLWAVYERIRELTRQFERVRFFHVPRENNTLADSIVNKVLDEHEAG